ncbi:MAG: TonB-dependent receptor [Acidobacteria bacterium]|nr:TonB-dependent receptor [Acidobacteriota bacterium]
MKLLFSALLALIFCAGISAQTGATVTGTVFLDGQPAGDAVVQLTTSSNPTRTITTRTDSNGVYRFENLEPGTYQLWAEKRGPEDRPGLVGAALGGAFGTVTVKVGQLKTIDLKLTLAVYESSFRIREFVTIAADSNQFAEQISKSISVIGAQEMRDRADFSLVETLRSVPGFRVQQLGGFGRTASIKSRGLRNQDTAVLIDGIRFRDASSISGDASAFLSDFTLTSVSKIEVLRGSGSSLYGTNAIGGTIDFQTPRPQKDWHGSLSGAFGGLGLGRFRGNISKGMIGGKFGFTAGLSRTAYTKGIDGDDRADNTNFQTRVEFNPFSKTSISARLFASDAYVKLNNGPDTFGTPPNSNAGILFANPGINFLADANDPDNRQRSNFYNGQVVLTQAFTSDFIFEAFYSGLSTERRNENGPLGTGFQSASKSVFEGAVQTAGAKFKWTPTRSNTLNFGYEFESERFRNDGFTPGGTGNFSTTAKQSGSAVFVQDLASFFDGRLQLAGGFRTQFFDLDVPSFSRANGPYQRIELQRPPTAYTVDGSVSYYFETSKTKLRAHIGNGYRVPSLYERFGTFFSSFSSAFVALGDPGLEPEKTLAFDVGIEQRAIKDRAVFSAVYFYTRLDRTIGFGNEVPNIGTTTRPFGGYVNTKGGIARGGEFSADIKATRSTDIAASYTFTNSDQRVPQVTGNPSIETLGIPAHQFTVVATQRYKDFWVNFDLLATSNYLAPIFSNSTFRTYVFQFKGNRRADLTAGYTFKVRNDKMSLRLFGTAENLFDHEYYENGFRTAGRNGRIGLSFGF